MRYSTSIAFSARPPKIKPSEIKPDQSLRLLAVAVRRQERKIRRWRSPKQLALPFDV